MKNKKHFLKQNNQNNTTQKIFPHFPTSSHQSNRRQIKTI